MYCVYFVIGENESVAEEYNKFMQYRLDYETTGEFPEYIKKNAPEHIRNNAQRYFNYLNHGWIDKVRNNKDKKIKYSFNDMLECAQIDSDKKDMCRLIFNYCSKFTHGNYYNQNINENIYLWILSRVGLIVFDFGREFIKMFKTEFKYNNVDLAKFLVDSNHEASELFEKFDKGEK